MVGARWPRVIASGLAGGCAFAMATHAAGAETLPGNCTANVNGSVTCSYSYDGGEQQFVVPAGVASVTVEAVGARGVSRAGPHSDPVLSFGADVMGTVPVTPGATLYVEVGGDGYSQGGFNGGGAGGGGGATDLRTSPAAAGLTPVDSRLIVAGGGGGDGQLGRDGFSPPDNPFPDRGLGGDAGSAGSGGEGCPANEAGGTGNNGGGGGRSGTLTAGGAGGTSADGTAAAPGTLGSGGAGGGGGDFSGSGGGGGGGYYGGGAGGNGGSDSSGLCTSAGGGGGGGSSLVPSGGSQTTASGYPGDGSLTITYSAVAPAAPQVTRVSPDLGPASGGTRVVIVGSGFTGATKVVFAGVPATRFTVRSASKIVAVSPPHEPGTVQIRVRTTQVSPRTPSARYTYR